MRVRADRVYDLPFFDGHVRLASVDGRPFVPTLPLCIWLGINAAAQDRRLERHARLHQLELVKVEGCGLAIPLEDVSWFLRTLRPRIPDPHDRWTRTRQVLCAMLIDFHVRTHNRYFASRAREKLIDRDLLPQRVSHRTRLTTADGARMKQLREGGWSLRRIADEYGYSKAVISLICNDKYPVLLRDASADSRQAVESASLNGAGAQNATQMGDGTSSAHHAPLRSATASERPRLTNRVSGVMP